VKNKCGTEWYNPQNQRCENKVIETKCGNDWYNYATHYCKNGTTPAQFGSLEYAGQTYKTVEIGEQIWMAENLNYNAKGSKCVGDNGYSLVDGNTATCNTYGRLYNWATAMANSASSTANPSGVRGVCPTGWHLPSYAEWTTLTDFAGGTKFLNGGTDDYGFAALTGYGYGVGNTFSSGEGGWWSTTEFEHGNDLAYFMNRSLPMQNYELKSFLRSVRCVQD